MARLPHQSLIDAALRTNAAPKVRIKANGSVWEASCAASDAGIQPDLPPPLMHSGTSMRRYQAITN